MQTASSQNALEWEGGSIDDLIGMLAAPALAVRVEVRTPAAGRPKKVGEIHLVAGGISEVMAGDLRGDDAMDQLRGCSPLSFRLQPRLPNPDDGGLLIPGPSEGTLAERPPAELMRYCELYVLTCVVELWRDTDRASIQYNKGEIARTMVNGSEASERLPEVMSWSSGGYQLILPELSLPAPAVRTPAPVTTAAPVAARPAPEPAPARTIFGYTAPAASKVAPVAVQTASSAPRATQPRASESSEERRATATGHPVDVYDKREPERVTNAGVPAVATPVAAPAAAPEPAAPAQAAPVLDTLPGPAERKTAAAPEKKAVAPQPQARRDDADDAAEAKGKPKKKSVKRRERRESRQMEVASKRQGRDERPMTAAKPAKKDMSVGAHVGIGLAIGLGIAAIYWIIQMVGN